MSHFKAMFIVLTTKLSSTYPHRVI